MNNSILALSFCALALTAQGATVTISNITGTWSNAVPGADVAGGGTANPTARWGEDFGFGLSGYNFSAVTGAIAVTIPPSPSSVFSLGTFTHVNQPIFPPSITGIRLTLNADIDIDGTSFGSRNFVFNFFHNETTNDLDPCPFGGANMQGVNINGCADRVQVNASFLTEDFVIGSEIFTLRIRGFGLDGGAEETEFLTTERAINDSRLLGDVALRSVVIPEPSTFVLAASAAVLALVARRRR